MEEVEIMIYTGKKLRMQLTAMAKEYGVPLADYMDTSRIHGDITIGESIFMIQFARNASNQLCTMDSYMTDDKFSYDFDKKNKDPNQVLPELVIDCQITGVSQIDNLSERFEGIKLVPSSDIITLFKKRGSDEPLPRKSK